mgnify:CR=1 FL=1
MNYYNKDKKYLVTGGTGFLGEKLVFKLLEQHLRLRVIARNEGKLVELQQKHPSIEIYTGDVSNQFDAHQACKGISGVYHLAAYKHVGLAEKFSRECTQSNVNASLNILEESLKNKFDFVIGISTDKAAQVSGVYGATKYLMEALFKQYEALNEETQYRIVRYGNVLYSTGSVLCKWKNLLKQGKEVVVTDLKATRFFWTRDEAIKLIFTCLDESATSKPYVPDMKAMDIETLLDAMAKKYLPQGSGLKIKTIGLQPGENLHEKILENGPFSNEVERFSIEEIIQKI